MLFNALENVKIKKYNTFCGYKTTADCIICIDFDTYINKTNFEEKKHDKNYITDWKITIKYNNNFIYYYGKNCSSLCNYLLKIKNILDCDDLIIYCEDLYEFWVFFGKFLINKYTYPKNILNKAKYYPLAIEFNNGIIFRDLLSISCVNVAKWADELCIEYTNKSETMCNCLDIFCITINKKIYDLPLTISGIIRKELVSELGKSGKDYYKKIQINYNLYKQLNSGYFGGISYANSIFAGLLMNNVVFYDYSSEYPFALCAYKYPHKFTKYDGKLTIEDILINWDKMAYSFKIKLFNLEIIDDKIPFISGKNIITAINIDTEGEKIIKAEYLEMYLNEVDLLLLITNYDFDEHYFITDIYISTKKYLPRKYTDFIYNLFYAKCEAKLSENKTRYNIAKIRLNSVYGNFVIRNDRRAIIENEDGTYNYDSSEDDETCYNKYNNKKSAVFPYQWGVWCCSYARLNYMQIIECVDKDGIWLYGDTDCGGATKWDLNKINKLNEERRELLLKNGYNNVNINGYIFNLGELTFDKECIEFIAGGSKRYCYRDKEDGELYITISGVPKQEGKKCLNNDINNFKTGFIFEGKKTGKIIAEYHNNKGIIRDKNHLVGNYLTFRYCDYKLDANTNFNEKELNFETEIIRSNYYG